LHYRAWSRAVTPDAVLFALLGAGLLPLLFARQAKRGKKSFGMLSALFACAFAAVFAYQACWQLGIFGGDRFAAFMRQHNTREGRETFRIQRGRILDANGEVLAERGENRLRHYPLGAAGTHVVGFYDRRLGTGGMERMMNAALRGEVSTEGESMRQTLARKIGNDRVEGEDVRLTLVADLQRFAHAQLENKRGAVVVMRPDGALLALATAPSYAPGDAAAASLDTEGAPMLNRATDGLYPPGSVFKIVVALAAAEAGMKPVLDCPAEGFMGIRDSEYYAAQRRGTVWRGWGSMNMRDGFVHSSNVYFSQLAVSLGQARLEALADSLRLNGRWVYASAGERERVTAAGKFPSLALRRDLAHAGIGQGAMAVTPLHVAQWTGVVANNGVLWQPRLLATSHEPAPKRIVSATAAREVAAMMRGAVASGTGRHADVPGLRVCGKTGTAQTGSGPDHAWFTCFAPQDNPQIVVTVLVDRGGFGGAVAAPIARAVLEEAARLGLLAQ
jgi:peptidoglycan glycosyltransferase